MGCTYARACAWKVDSQFPNIVFSGDVKPLKLIPKFAGKRSRVSAQKDSVFLAAQFQTRLDPRLFLT